MMSSTSITHDAYVKDGDNYMYPDTTPSHSASSSPASFDEPLHTTTSLSPAPDAAAPPIPAPTARNLDIPALAAHHQGHHHQDHHGYLTPDETRLLMHHLIESQRHAAVEISELRQMLHDLTRWVTEIATAHNNIAGIQLQQERLLLEIDWVLRRMAAARARGSEWWDM